VTIRATLTVKVFTEGGEPDTYTQTIEMEAGRWPMDLFEMNLAALGWLEANHG
jgi:hypothetical protein